MYSLKELSNLNIYKSINPDYRLNYIIDKKQKNKKFYTIIILLSIIISCLILIYFYSKYQTNSINIRDSSYEKLVKKTDITIITPSSNVSFVNKQ